METILQNSMLVLLLLPIAGALFVPFFGDRSKEGGLKALTFAFLLSMVELGFGVWVFLNFQGETAAPEFEFILPWFQLGDIPIRFYLAIDGLSILMVLLTVILLPIVFLAASGHIHERRHEFAFWTLIMQAGMLGVFLAQDAILFYVFWELTLIPLYFIVGIWGGPRKYYAAVKFFLYTLAGSLLMLIGLIVLLQTTNTADMVQLAQSSIPYNTQMFCFLLFAAGFAVKIPVVPFHTWLPDAHVEAPTGGSMILAGVLLKMGTYGFLRVCLPIFPAATMDAAPWFMGIGALGVVYGAFLAWAQQDLKKLVAYSSISHLGLITVGLFAANTIGVQGAIIQMFNHGVSTGALFLLVGMIYERRHTRDIGDFGGIAKVMPLYTICFGIVTFSSIGLPGLNGFVGEFLVLVGSFQAIPWIAAIAGLGIIFGAVYMLSMFRRTFLGKLTSDANRNLKDMVPGEIIAIIPLIVLIVWVGIAPKTFMSKSEAAVQAIVQRLEGK